MTRSPRTSPLPFSDFDQAVAALRARGLRLSAPRRRVLEALFAADGPVAAERIASVTGVDVTSVYRNLEALEAHGVVRHVHLGHGPGLHALAGPREREYLYCEGCSRVRAVERAELDGVRSEIRARFGFEARFTHFAIGGLCETCAASGEGSAHAQQDGLHSHGDHIHSHPPLHPELRS